MMKRLCVAVGVVRGTARLPIERMPVNVSDLERTLLDALDHPRLVGGMRRALDLFSKSLARADPSTLIEHAGRGSRHSTCQRAGVLLERRGVRPLWALDGRFGEELLLKGRHSAEQSRPAGGSAFRRLDAVLGQPAPDPCVLRNPPSVKAPA